MLDEQELPKTICVTGGTGFIASHVVQGLLQNGYHVRTTVRDIKNKDRLRHLFQMKETFEEIGIKLELFEANLLNPGAFDDIIEGCWGVIHVASPVAISRVEDPQRDLIEPAVNGTLNVLKACAKAKVKKVVVTSSIGSIRAFEKVTDKQPVFDESDHNRECSLAWEAYSFSKVKAEEATYDFVAALPEEDRFPVVTIHPSVVIGPQISTSITSSNAMIYMFMSGEYPLSPPIHLQLADVRDVARAHVFALESPKAQGRYIVSNSPPGYWINDLGKLLKKEFPDYPISTTQMPYFLLWLVSCFDNRITAEVLNGSGRISAAYDGTKIVKELGFEYLYRDKMETTLRDGAQSMIDLHIVKKPTKKSSFGWIVRSAIVGALAAGAYYYYTRFHKK